MIARHIDLHGAGLPPRLHCRTERICKLKYSVSERLRARVAQARGPQAPILCPGGTMTEERMKRHRKRLAPGSMPVEGSSSRTTAGSPTRATATLSFRLLPPEYVSHGLFAYCYHQKSFGETCMHTNHTSAVHGSLQHCRQSICMHAVAWQLDLLYVRLITFASSAVLHPIT